MNATAVEKYLCKKTNLSNKTNVAILSYQMKINILCCADYCDHRRKYNTNCYLVHPLPPQFYREMIWDQSLCILMAKNNPKFKVVYMQLRSH